MSKELKIKDINALHTDLGHPSEEITQVTGKAMGFYLKVSNMSWVKQNGCTTFNG